MENKRLQKTILASIGMAAIYLVVLFLAGELRWEWSGARMFFVIMWVFTTIRLFYKYGRKPTSVEQQPAQ